MRIGAIFPHQEIGTDPAAIRAYAEAVEELGFTHIVAYDHVLGASAEQYSQERLPGPYREHDLFHEVFVLFGFMAAVTRKIEFSSQVLISPQRQTALVAKQAAEVDVLSAGRLRLGIGTGWNDVEYEALGVSFSERGQRQEEQIHLLRELWTKPLVHFQGRFHTVTNAGLNPLPVQRPIPIWLGGYAEAVLRRVAALADGWIPAFQSLNPSSQPSAAQRRNEIRAKVERMRGYAREVGRDPASIGIEGRVMYANQASEDWGRTIEAYRELGATHMAVNTMKAGLENVDAHIHGLRRFRDSLPAYWD